MSIGGHSLLGWLFPCCNRQCSWPFIAVGCARGRTSRRRTGKPNAREGGRVIGNFHFIRPEWLLALIPAALLWWLLRWHTDAAQPWRGIIAPHLLPHLLSGEEEKSR